MMGKAVLPKLGAVWPFAEFSVPASLAQAPLGHFFSTASHLPAEVALVTQTEDPRAAPSASYALQIITNGGRLVVSRWNPQTGTWQRTFSRNFDGDQPDAICVLEFKQVYLADPAEPLASKMRRLMRGDIMRMDIGRFSSKLFALAAVVILFFAIREGAEVRAYGPFLVILGLAVLAALTATSLRNGSRALCEACLARAVEQIRFERNWQKSPVFTEKDAMETFRKFDQRREDEAAVFGFLLLLCIVYFISPLVVIGVLVALVLGVLILTRPDAAVAAKRAQRSAEHDVSASVLALRAGEDPFSPPSLRRARRHVLHTELQRATATEQAAHQLSTAHDQSSDLSAAVILAVILGTYALPIAAGYEVSAVSHANSLVSLSLFTVAPIVVLISICKSTMRLAHTAKRYLSGTQF